MSRNVCTDVDCCTHALCAGLLALSPPACSWLGPVPRRVLIFWFQRPRHDLALCVSGHPGPNAIPCLFVLLMLLN